MLYVHRDPLYSGSSDEGSVLYVHRDPLYSGSSDEGSVLYVHRDPLYSGSSDEGSVLYVHRDAHCTVVLAMRGVCCMYIVMHTVQWF